MKKNYFLIVVAIVGVMFLNSCSSTKVSSYSMAPYRNVTGVGVVNVPTLADLEVNQNKIIERVSVKMDASDGTISSAAIENVVNRVLSDLLLKRNADVLVQPVVKTETKGSTVTIDVSGYPAIYKNFRSMTVKDAELFKDINILHIPQGIVQSVITTEK